MIWFFGTYSRGSRDVLWASHFRISGVWFRQLSVLRRPSLEDYGQMLLLPLTVRGRSRLDHLVDLKRLALLAISIGGPHITHFTGLLQSELISFIRSISISRIMLRSLILLRPARSHDHHIREPLLTRYLGHMHRGPRDSSLRWA